MVQLQNDELFDILVGKISATINRTFLRTFTAEGICYEYKETGSSEMLQQMLPSFFFK